MKTISERIGLILLFSMAAFGINITAASGRSVGYTNTDKRNQGKSEQVEPLDSILLHMCPQLEYVEGDSNITFSTETTYNDSQPNHIRTIEDNTYVPTKVQVDTTKSTVEIQINSGMSPSGAKTYEIPIEIFPGMNGMQPNVSLQYNSLSGMGCAGMGWNISGLASIDRVVKNGYYDYTPKGMTMDVSDAFCLDGLRLIRTGQNRECMFYRTERDNIKVTAYYIFKQSEQDRVVKYFEVFYPDGKRAVFGTKDNMAHQINYPITELSDLYGNKITYEYEHVFNHHTLKKISYNNASISFEYIDRKNSIKRYAGGLEIEDREVLSKIVCKNDGTPIRTYLITHIKSKNDQELLNTIRLYANGVYSNAIKFYYGEGETVDKYSFTKTIFPSYYKFSKPNDIRIAKGKFDYYSGVEGIAVYNNALPFEHCVKASTSHSHSENYFKNYNNADDKILVYTSMSEDWADTFSPITKGSGFIDLLTADLKGKQEEYLIRVNNNVVAGKDQITFSVYNISEWAGIRKLYDRTFSFSSVFTDFSKHSSVTPKYFYTGDFTGNGKMEVLAISADNPFGGSGYPTSCYLFDLENNSIIYSGSPLILKMLFPGDSDNADEISNKSDRLMAFDCDGDGKTDICHINETGIHTYTFQSSINGYDCINLKTSTYTKTTSLYNKDIIGGDFNGDGNIDLMAVPRKSLYTSWEVLFSKGDGTFSRSYISGLTRSTAEGAGVIAQDINGDGITDIIAYDSTGFSTFFGSLSQDWNKSFSTSFPVSNSAIAPSSLTSNNTFTKLISIKDETVTKYSFDRDDNKSTMITGMINCHGAVEKNRYEPLSGDKSNIDHYEPGRNAVFPFINISEPIQVIAETADYLEGTKISSAKYMYKNAVLHRQGLGFCGFEEITSFDIDYKMTQTIYDPYKFGIIKKETSPTQEISYEYDVNIDTSKFTQILLKKKEERDLLTKFSSTSEYKYDTYGYEIQEKRVFSDGFYVTTDKTYTNSIEADSLYYLGFVTDEVVTTFNSQSIITDRTYIPSHSHRKPLKTLVYKNGNLMKTTEYTYNSNGNVTVTSETPFSSNARKTLTTYTPQGLVASKSQDGRSVVFTYKPFGKPATKRDWNGSTTYTYDPFGRDKKIEYPNGSSETFAYVWRKEGTNGITGVERTETGKPKIVTVFDAAGRKVRTSQMMFDGKSKIIDQEYDVYGNVIRQSAPFSGTKADKWSTYTYDKYNRKLSYTDPLGKKTQYSYVDNKTTMVKNGVTTTKEVNSQGQLISSTDAGGTISYKLAADGQPISITTPENIKTEFTYDTYRRRTGLKDPSYGNVYTSYTSSGQIESETNANGKKVLYEYDSFDRLVKKITPEMTVEYKYDSNWRPSSITTSTGSSISYTYTPAGDIASTIETAPGGKKLTKGRTYSGGLLKAMTYTTNKGFIGKETYDYKNGYLSTVTLNDTAKIYELVSDGLFGPSSLQTYRLQRSYDFYDNGFPMQRQVGKNLFAKVEFGDSVIQAHPLTDADIAGTSGIGDFGPVTPVYPAVIGTIFSEVYGFDFSTGNLTKRTDKLHNIVEIFKYDAFNRLTGYGKNGTEFQLTYEDNGNISTKSDLGTLEYTHPSKPYAITGVEVTDNANALPTWTQDVTYTSFHRPASITENGYVASFYYNHDYHRTKMEMKKDSKVLYSKYYLGDCLEIEEHSDGNYTERLYLCGDYYKAPIVLIKENNAPVICNIIRDYIGNVRYIVDQDLKILQSISYDPWGRLRPTTSFTPYAYDKMPKLLIGRGFTGHEHIAEFGLVNMNARLYDPVLGRFLSPDPYVQMPDFSQNFNRYSYAFNNPFAYSDPDGEFFIFTFLTGLVESMVNVIKHGFNFSQYNWTFTSNAWKIDMGMFKGSFKQIVNKWTIGIVNSFIGNVMAHGFNAYKGINKESYDITYLDGMAAISDATPGTSAMTVGHYSFGPKGYKADFHNYTFVHEYGHYIQSQRMGIFYFPVVAIPSILSAGFISNIGGPAHDNRWFEVNASKLGGDYFDKRYGTGAKGYESGNNAYFDYETFKKNHNTDKPVFKIWELLVLF